MNEKPSYYAIIPANVRYDKDLPPMAKLLYGEITCLTQREGFCWASNGFFADLYNMSKDRVSKLLKILADKGYLSIKIERNENKEIVRRYIKITEITTGISENNETPLVENNEENNTSMNNTSMNNINLNNVDNSNELPRSSKKQTKKDLPQEAKDLTDFLYNSCRNDDSRFHRTEKELEKWTEIFEKIHRLDGRDWNEIDRVLKWARKNNFWKINILSASKFREKYERLYVQSLNDLSPNSNNSNSQNYEDKLCL